MNNASQVVAVLNRTRAKYVDSAKSDILTALNFFPDLSPDAENFTFPDGTRSLTFRLKGTIPVLYKVGLARFAHCGIIAYSLRGESGNWAQVL